MNKILPMFFILALLFTNLSTTYAQKIPQQIIPTNAIRIRILANSNSPKDQAMKLRVRDVVNQQLNQWMKEADSLEKSRQIIKSHLSDLNSTVASVIGNQSYQIEFKKDVPFPTKWYNNFLYQAGNYEGLLITLGNGAGDNWWSILFPPLSFLDKEKKEVKSFFQELFHL